jgi:hypothetical protein
MGAFVLIATATAVGTIAAVIAQHYLRQALKRWLEKKEPS